MHQSGEARTALNDMPAWHITKSIQESFSDNRLKADSPERRLPVLPQRKRFTLSQQEGRGYYDFVHFHQGLMLLVCNRHLNHDIATKFICEGFIKIHFRISGEAKIVFQDEDSLKIEGLYCGIMTQPKGTFNGVTYKGGVEEKWITIFCSPDQLSKYLGDGIANLPKSLASFSINEASEFYIDRVPVHPAMTYAISSIINPGVCKSLEFLRIEAAVLELLSLALDGVMEDSAKKESVKLSITDMTHIHEVKEILFSNYADPPRLDELAKLVGMNQIKLNYGFKAMFGNTMSKYILECRMKEALRLLEEGGLNITQISNNIGYDYSSNFSTAFKRYFGISPKSINSQH